MDTLNTIAAVFTILGMLIVAGTLITLVRQNQIQAYQTIYTSMLSIDQFFAEHPDLKSYIYDGKGLPDSTHKEYPKVLSTCEMICDLFEEVIGCRVAFSKDKWDGWVHYMTSLYQESIALKEFMALHKRWYTPELLELLDRE
jgi:hypothetical protein